MSQTLDSVPAPSPSPDEWPETTSRPPSRTRAGLASVLALSVLAGGGAGVAGAAAWDSWTPDQVSQSGAATGDVPTTPVVADDRSADEAKAPANSGGLNTAAVAAQVLPSVVRLDVSGQQGAGSGSGVLLSADGRILTNNHVVEVAESGGSIRVSFNDGSHADATVVGTDPLTDVAVVQAEGVADLTPASIGESGGLKVGQPVVAVGSPYGLDATVTSGIVSALDRPVNVGADGAGNVTAYPAVQTDAAINPGNSGGPLVDNAGRVIGINASIRSTSSTDGQAGSIGLGFAIPIDEVMPIVDQIVAGETPTHARLGVSLPTQTQQSGVGEGATLGEVTAGSAAASGGLQAGDVVTAIEGRPIAGADGLIAIVRSYRPDTTVTLTYARDGKERTTEVTLGSDQGSARG